MSYFFSLRLTKLNDEMKESDMGALGDETYNEVFRDYTQMAHSHPERLIRANQRDIPDCDAPDVDTTSK